MSVQNLGALNTLRIETINKDIKPNILTSFLRVGTMKTGNVDNGLLKELLLIFNRMSIFIMKRKITFIRILKWS